MFNNIYGSDFSSVFSPKSLAFAVIGVFTIYFLSIGFTLLVEKSNYSRGAMIQAIYRSNFVLMGLPIAANIFGKDKLGMTAVLVAVVVPIYNMLAVITLEIFERAKDKCAENFKRHCKKSTDYRLCTRTFVCCVQYKPSGNN